MTHRNVQLLIFFFVQNSVSDSKAVGVTINSYIEAKAILLYSELLTMSRLAYLAYSSIQITMFSKQMLTARVSTR